jgi:hypothetical protein
MGSLEDRLSDIEGELSRLTSLFKTTGGGDKTSIDIETEEESPVPFLADDQITENATSLEPIDRYIVRSQVDLTDRYHGPCTLFALCNEFRDTVHLKQQTQSSTPATDRQQSKKQDGSATEIAINDLLACMCLEAGTKESFDLQSNHMPIRPPKKFLLMVQAQFFQQTDYATDIFVQSCFWSNVERIYSRPFTPADEAWAICFNTIILLVLGSEIYTQGNDPLVGSQFALPFLSTVRTALSNPRILMAPKLINVQTLALLVSSPTLLSYTIHCPPY